MSFNSDAKGVLLPTTFIWDPAEIYALNISEEIKELFVKLYQNISAVQTAVNMKSSGIYGKLEEVTGNKFFPTNVSSSKDLSSAGNDEYGIVIEFGALPNSATKNVAHGLTISTTDKVTCLYGAATDPANKRMMAIPNTNAYLEVDATNVKITTSANLSNFTTTFVVLKRLKL